MKKTIIKCTDCGFKYYDGDVHPCGGIEVEEKTIEPEEKKRPQKLKKKESFKIW